MKIILIAMLFWFNDSTVVVYRHGLKGVKIVREPIKVYESTPKRKIQYIYPSEGIKMRSETRGVIKKK